MTTTGFRDLPRADIGIIGGSGFYELASEGHEVKISTPYGEPSDVITVATLGGRSVAFLPRHGRSHRYPAHQINYRANLWALRSLGVEQVLAPCAVGSLRPELGPGSIVVPDDLVDRTGGRIQTFFDSGAVHVSFADPYCPQGRATVLKSSAEAGMDVRDGGVMVVIQGPRFSTRAESRWYAAQGWSLVNMTGHPEAVLARELAMCYTAIALVTDHDAGIGVSSAVAQRDVFEVFAEHSQRLREFICQVVPALPSGSRACLCARSHDGIELPMPLPLP
jgi:5'-methylthioadenosine phosphorylase